MIPRRLRLHNFLSYRDCTIDFSSLHLAAISGPNGHGKSALLDGITWALWGRCRAATDDEAIYLGQPEMLVDFEFEIEGDRFAVNRKKTRGKTAQLQLFQIDGTGGRAPITGSVMRETQADINRLVLFDHEAFRNSVFIAQGHADEFTRKAPADRKRVLRSVLGLERYEDYSSKSRDFARERDTELRSLRARLQERLQRLEKLPEVIERLAELLQQEKDAAAASAAAFDEVTELQATASEYDRRRTAAQEAESALLATEAALTLARDRRSLVQRELERLENDLKDEETVRTQFAQLEAVRKEAEQLSAKQGEVEVVRASARGAELVVEREAAALETTIKSLRTEINTHEEQALKIPALVALAETRAPERTKLQELAAEARAASSLATTCRERAKAARDTAISIEKQARELKSREVQLAGAAQCPVCQSPLDAVQTDRLREEYAAERRALGQAYRDALKSAEADETAALEHEQATDSLEKRLRECDAELRLQEQALAADIDRARKSELLLGEARTKLCEKEAVLAAGEFAREAREAAERSRAAIASIDYDPARHAEVRKMLVALEPVEVAFRRVDAAHGKLPYARDLVAVAEAALAQNVAELTVAQERLEAARRDLAAAVDVAGPLQQALAKLGAANDLAREVARLRGQAEVEREGLVAEQAKLEEDGDREAALADETGLYNELAAAFGRDGIQAMLIDQAIPRMEAIANDLLESMTAGRINLQLATRRENKSGKVTETLDIRISDELGQRDYEMFSGGEAFRIDLALRIALSQTLAERSGASLATLLIDEGFGTQDAEGLDRLVDAIVAIKDRFRLILVVTHIDDLKQRFDRRIEIFKDEGGSTAVIC